MNSVNTVTALIPCFNEEGRIGKVLEALEKSSFIHKIIVVNDGSLDNSKNIIQEFKQVKLLDLSQNVGKGFALKEGIKLIKTEITFLCDADLIGLREKEIEKLITPLIKENYKLCVGVRKRGNKAWQYLRRNFFPLIAGERAIETKHLKKILNSPYAEGWGIEPYINFYFRKNKLKVKKVDLEGVIDLSHIKKKGFMDFFKRLGIFLIIYFKLFILNFTYKNK